MEKAHLIRAAQIGAAVLIVALVIGVYKAKTDASRTEAHVRALQRQIADGEADIRALRADIAQQETPANVERLARERLGVTAGSESHALPESAIDRALPAPRSDQPHE
ncbi:hypothetical protein [Terricaulis sp.]|uniref:cell division protein FtsL n=1 Tax=Terricaulis sp. TaxID=2768686 RepID=UPI00378460C5